MDNDKFKALLDAFAKNIADNLSAEMEKDVKAAPKHEKANPAFMPLYKKLFGSLDAKLKFGHFVFKKGGLIGAKKFRAQIREMNSKVDFVDIVINMKTGKMLLHEHYPQISGIGSYAGRFMLNELNAFAKQHPDIVKRHSMSAGGFNVWKMV